MHFKLLIFLSTLLILPAKTENPFAETIAQSKKEGKEILLVFTGSDWCQSCMHFKDQVLDQPEMLKEIEVKYIIHIVDFPRKNNQSKEKIAENGSLAEAYNQEGTFPKILIIDHLQTKSNIIPYSPGAEKKFLRVLSN